MVSLPDSGSKNRVENQRDNFQYRWTSTGGSYKSLNKMLKPIITKAGPKFLFDSG